MSTFIYDEALVNKIKKWCNSTQINVLGVNETNQLFEIMADTNDDKPITLPLITISRGRGFSIVSEGATKKALSFDGAGYNRNIYNKGTDDVYTTTDVLNAIPISLSYQVDVYTRYAKEADLLVRNLIFNFINYPQLNIIIPGAEYTHMSNITLDSNIQDNSDIPERFIVGNFTRLSLSISIDDAYLWDNRELRDTNIEIVLDDSSGDTPYVWDDEIPGKLVSPDLTKFQHMKIPTPEDLNN